MEKINIAIADDNERMQEMLGNVIKQDDTLELIGQTGNGNDIYSIIRDKEPDVVLLDIFMPKMDGLTVMEKVNEDKNLKKRPAFIVVSAVGEERITEDAFRLGAYYYVLKPFDNETLLNRIKATKGMTAVRRYHPRNFTNPGKEPICPPENSLEIDVTNMIHRDRRSCPYQRIPVPARCDSAFRRGHGNAQFHYQDSLSDHRETPPDNVKSCRACHPPCD